MKMRLYEILSKAADEQSSQKLRNLIGVFLKKSSETDIIRYNLDGEKYESELYNRDLTQVIEAHLVRGFDSKDQTAAGEVLGRLKRFDARQYQNPRDELIEGLMICASLVDAAYYLKLVKRRFQGFVKDHPSRYNSASQTDINNMTFNTIGLLEYERTRVVNYLLKLVQRITEVRKPRDW